MPSESVNRPITKSQSQLAYNLSPKTAALKMPGWMERIHPNGKNSPPERSTAIVLNSSPKDLNVGLGYKVY